MQVQEAERFTIKMNPKRSTLRHIIINMAKFKDKERILKAAREKQEVTYREDKQLTSQGKHSKPENNQGIF